MSVNDDAIALKGGKGPWLIKIPATGRTLISLSRIVNLDFVILH